MKLSRTAKRKAPSRQRPCGCKMGKRKRKRWGGEEGRRRGKGRVGKKAA